MDVYDFHSSEKTMLMKSLEKVQLDLNALKSKYEDVKRSKQDLLVQVSGVGRFDGMLVCWSTVQVAE